jgi:hypothetical protein
MKMDEGDDLSEILGRIDPRTRATLGEVVRTLRNKRSSVYQMLCALDVQRDGMVPRRVVAQVFTRLGVDVPSSELEALLTVFEKRDAEFGELVDYLDIYHVLTKYSDADAPIRSSSSPPPPPPCTSQQPSSYRAERGNAAGQLSSTADTRSWSPTQRSPGTGNANAQELSPLRRHLQQIGRGIDSIGERVDRVQYTSPLRTSPTAPSLSPALKLSQLASGSSSGPGLVGLDLVLRERLQTLEAVSLSGLRCAHSPPPH